MVVPAATPVTTPVEEPIVAADVLLLTHVPPAAFVKVVVAPAQIEVVPVIAAGTALTETTPFTEQPVANIYVTEAVPEATPVTTPLEEPIVATDVLLLLHVPLPELATVIEEPAHTADMPVIAEGSTFTVNVVLDEVPQPVL
jgi:hypothetical protein